MPPAPGAGADCAPPPQLGLGSPCGEKSPPPPVPPPPRGACTVVLANLALCAANVVFGAGGVVGKMGLHGVNPILFALLREAVAGPLLCLGATQAWAGGGGAGVLPLRRHWWRFALCGCALFTTNFTYILGVKLAGPTTAAIWQPAQPVVVGGAATLLGYEQATLLKGLGTLVAVCGCLLVVLGPTLLHDDDGGSSSSGSGGEGDNQLVGNLVFALQICGASGFWVAQKPLLSRYTPIAVLSWSYILASFIMLGAALIVNDVRALLDFVCDDCDGDGWHVPPGSLLAIAYFIFGVSIAAYMLSTWGNQHVNVSLLGVYTVVQPIATIVAAEIAIASSAAPHWGLHGPRRTDLFCLVIVAGLAIVVWDNWRAARGGGAAPPLLSDAGGSSDEDGSDDGGDGERRGGRVNSKRPRVLSQPWSQRTGASAATHSSAPMM